MARPDQNFTATVYHASPAARVAAPFDPVEAVAVVTAAVALFLVFASSLSGPLGIVVAQLVGAAVPLAWAAARRRSLAALGFGRPRLAPLAGAVLLGATFWYVNLQIARPLLDHFGRGELPSLERTVLAGDSSLMRLLAFALVPAVCEELLMRGVLARSLVPIGPRVAVVASALAFALFHLSAVRFAPTLLLGLVLATLAVRTGTIWASIVTHLLNNAMALLVSDGTLQPLANLIDRHPDAALAVAAVGSLAGIALGARSSAS